MGEIVTLLDGNGTELYLPKSERGLTSVASLINDLIDEVQYLKPGDRSSADRSYAILVTDLEKAKAYAKVYIDDATVVKASE